MDEKFLVTRALDSEVNMMGVRDIDEVCIGDTDVLLKVWVW